MTECPQCNINTVEQDIVIRCFSCFEKEKRLVINECIAGLLDYLTKEAYEEADKADKIMSKEKDQDVKKFWDYKYHSQIVNAHHFEAMNTPANRKYYTKLFLEGES